MSACHADDSDSNSDLGVIPFFFYQVSPGAQALFAVPWFSCEVHGLQFAGDNP
jgi:hypothetical protein